MIYEDYKNLHQIPEIGFKEFKTSTYVLNRIKNTSATISTINTGICAFFDFKKEKTLAFRCELDALKIKEENLIDFASKHDGYMHACGHDGHIAILINLLHYVNNLHTYPYNVLFVFQPSEEKLGGAISLMPHLKKYSYKAFFGMHVFPILEEGKIYTSKNTIFSSATEIDVTIKNRSLHIADYNKKFDSIYKSFKLINYLEKLSKKEDVLLHFGKIKGGTARNVTAGNCTLKGSLRCKSNEKCMQFINKHIKDTKDITYKLSKTIPALCNDFEIASKLINELNIKEIITPFFQAEDFSFYNDFNPCFFLLGISTKNPLHSNNFILKESDLLNGYNFYIKLLNSCFLNSH